MAGNLTMLSPRDPPEPPIRPRIEPGAPVASAAPLAPVLRPYNAAGTILIGADGKLSTALPTGGD